MGTSPFFFKEGVNVKSGLDKLELLRIARSSR